MDDLEKYRFDVLFLGDVVNFLSDLNDKTREKILENIRISRFLNDPRLLKKINNNIWEFRTRYNSRQYRLLAFWDKTTGSLIVCTHGFIKKSQKLPAKEVKKANDIRLNYFAQKKR